MLKQTFINGIQRALHVRRLLPFYLVSLLFGMLQVWPALAAFRDPLAGGMASGGVDAFVDLFLASQSAVATAAGWSLLAIALALLSGGVYNFLAGGLLVVWAGGESFWAGCRSMFWPFVGLGALLLILVAVLLGLAVAINALIGSVWAMVWMLGMLQILNLLGEYSRAVAVVQGIRNPLVLFLRAVVFCGRNIGGVLALGLLGLLLSGAILGLYTSIAEVAGGTLAAIVVQQAVVFGWIWVKGLRLAWALSYLQKSAANAPV